MLWLTTNFIVSKVYTFMILSINTTYYSSCTQNLRVILRGESERGLKCHWIKKQIEHFHIQPLRYLIQS